MYLSCSCADRKRTKLDDKSLSCVLLGELVKNQRLTNSMIKLHKGS